jgi:hypothetical protein
MKMNPVFRAIASLSVALVFALFSVLAFASPVNAAAPEGAGASTAMSEMTPGTHGSDLHGFLSMKESKLLHKLMGTPGADIKIEVTKDGLVDREFKIEVKTDNDEGLLLHDIEFKKEVKIDADVDDDEGLLLHGVRGFVHPDVEKKIEVKVGADEDLFPTFERKVEVKKDFDEGLLPTIERKVDIKVDAGEAVFPITPKLTPGLHGIDKAIAPAAIKVAPGMAAEKGAAPMVAPRIENQAIQKAPASAVSPGAAPSTMGMTETTCPSCALVAPKVDALKGVAPMVAPRIEEKIERLAPATVPRLEREGDLRIHGIAPRPEDREFRDLGLDNSGPGNAEDLFRVDDDEVEIEDLKDLRDFRGIGPRVFPRGFEREFEFERD